MSCGCYKPACPQCNPSSGAMTVVDGVTITAFNALKKALCERFDALADSHPVFITYETTAAGLDQNPPPNLDITRPAFAYNPSTGMTFAWDVMNSKWIVLPSGAAGTADGKTFIINRASATTNQAPSATEAPGAKAGDTATVVLNTGRTEFWVYTASWGATPAAVIPAVTVPIEVIATGAAAPVAPPPAPNTRAFLAYTDAGALYYWDISVVPATWKQIPVGTAGGSDGRSYYFTRPDDTETGVAPKGTEIAAPVNGDSAIILHNAGAGPIGFWEYTGGAWNAKSLTYINPGTIVEEQILVQAEVIGNPALSGFMTVTFIGNPGDIVVEQPATGEMTIHVRNGAQLLSFDFHGTATDTKDDGMGGEGYEIIIDDPHYGGNPTTFQSPKVVVWDRQGNAVPSAASGVFWKQLTTGINIEIGAFAVTSGTGVNPQEYEYLLRVGNIQNALSWIIAATF